MSWITNVVSPTPAKAQVLSESAPAPVEKEKKDVYDLLDFIAKYESNGSYDVMYGKGDVSCTNCTLSQVLNMQRESTHPSTAIGRYQFIRPTLKGLKKELALTGYEKFDKTLQDKLAIKLLERRGFKRFLKGEISLQDFMYHLSKEWASLPKDMSGLSYYDGDGLNKAHACPKKLAELLNNIRIYNDNRLS